MLKELKKSFKQINRDEDVFNCIKLRRVYLKAKDSSLPPKQRIEHLLNSLVIAADYEERLTHMKISSKSIRAKVASIYAKRKNEIINETADFYKKRKGDQDKIIAIESESITVFIDKIDNFIEIIDDALEYVRSASFSMKSVLNGVKEYISGE